MAKFDHVFDPNRGHHKDHAVFLAALAHKTKLNVRFYSKEDDRELQRKCAPLDFGPSRRTADDENRYHFWDYESDTKNHVLSLKREQLVEMVSDGVVFNPRDLVVWDVAKSPWFTKRDWGSLS